MRTVADWSPMICPEHSAQLEFGDAQLHCPKGHSFPIRSRIPRFVPTEGYAAAFGTQWKKYRRTQLDSYTGTTVVRNRLRRCLGDQAWTALAHAHVLEAGCGAGCFTEVLLSQGARVTSIDLSEAVDANCENFPISDQHRIAQADISALPFAPQTFDIVLCLGVVQHTPDPERTIKRLFDQVMPGGWLVIDHYPRDWKWFTTAKPIYRSILKRLPPEQGMYWSQLLVRVFLPLHRAARRFRPAQTVLSRISPVFHYYHVFPEFTDEIHEEWAFLDTHDAMTDWYKHRRSVEEIRQCLQTLGAIDIWCERGGNGVEARARRRPDPVRAREIVRQTESRVSTGPPKATSWLP